jgi:hypothetical protein
MLTPQISVLVLTPPLVGALAALVVARWYDLRRLDDPFVAGLAWFTAFWIVGAGLNSWFPDAPPVDMFTLELLFAAFGAFVVAGVFGAARLRARLGPQWAIRYAQLAPRRALSHPEVLGLCVCLGAGIAAFLLLIAFSGGVPALMEGVEQSRVEARAGRGFLVLGAIWLLTLPAVAFVADAWRTRRRRLLALAIVVVAAVVIALIGSRGPVVKLALGAAFVALVAGRSLPRWSRLAVLVGVAVVGLAVAAALRADWGFSAGGVVFRALWQTHVNVTNLARLTDFIPANHDYLLGGSYLTDLSVVLPGPGVNFGAWLKDALNLHFSGGGLTVGLVGESYANFGPVIAIGLCFAAGLILSAARGYVRLDSPLDAAFAVLLAISLGGFVQTGVMSVTLYNLIPLIGVYGVLRFAGRSGSRDDDAALRRAAPAG